MATRMTANELAADFARRFPQGGWLSAAQTSYLVNLYQQEARPALARMNRETGRTCAGPKSYEADGSIYEGNTLVATWTISKSPRNGCGYFQVTPIVTVADPRIQQLEEARQGLRILQERGTPEAVWGFIAERVADLERQLGVAA